MPKPAGEGAASKTDSGREYVVALLRENGHISRNLFRRRLKALNVTAAEARALMYLRSNDGIVQNRLAEILDVQAIALTRVMDRMELSGWVERRLSKADRRVRTLHITADGEALALRLHKMQDDLNAEITSYLSAEDLQGLAAALGRLNAALRTIR
jgi:DNA-binding MarR family transcriptional regulator